MISVTLISQPFICNARATRTKASKREERGERERTEKGKKETVDVREKGKSEKSRIWSMS